MVWAVDEPLAPAEARRFIHACLAAHAVGWSRHALGRMSEHGVSAPDVEFALRVGVVLPAEWESGSWRYRVRTRDLVVVVAFHSERRIKIVTVWRPPATPHTRRMET